MSGKELSPIKEHEFRLAAPGVLPPGLLHIGPGKTVAVFMVVADALALTLAFGLGASCADLVREVIGAGAGADRGWLGPRTDIFPLLLGLMIGLFGFGGLYQRDGWEAEEVKGLITGIALIALFDAALAYVTKDHFSRLAYACTWPLAIALVISLRMSLRAVPWIERLMTTHLVMVGSGIDRAEFAYQLRESRSGRVRVHQGMPLEFMQALNPHDLEVWLDGMALRVGVRPGKLQTMVVPSAAEQQAAQTLSERLAVIGRPFFVAVSYDGLARRGLSLHKIVGSDMVLTGVQPEPFPWIDLVVKRGLDLVLTMVGIVLIWPLLAGIAMALMLEGGPVFFRQVRVGRDRKRFHCLKFRSMRPDAEARLHAILASDPIARAEWDRHQKLADDPRITPLGRFLRATSLDELPQLFNVLKGEMSLVGPRPIVAPEVPGYDGDRAYYASAAFRHYAQCTPGITGLWQVSGRHGTAHDERVRLDRWYARNWSIWLDCVILFKTVRAVISRSGG